MEEVNNEEVILKNFKNKSYLGRGYVYAPYIPIICDVLMDPSKVTKEIITSSLFTPRKVNRKPRKNKKDCYSRGINPNFYTVININNIDNV